MLLDGLGSRWDHIDTCGLPDTLVHGDFHQGNLRSAGPGHLVLLDWGDSGIGHPMLDESAFLDRLSTRGSAGGARAVGQAVAPRDPRVRARPAAASLLAPLGAFRRALIYQRFLDSIEPDERIYHAPDPADWLEQAAVLSRA